MRTGRTNRLPAANLSMERLERHRDFHFRRTPARRVRSEKDALAFIAEAGFLTAFTPGLGLPCMREAIEGRREPELPEHIQHDHAIGMTWELKDSIAARKLAYYGKVLAGRPSFVSVALLPAFLRLRVDRGGYRSLYERGELSSCAKAVMDALSRSGPMETRALKLASGSSRSSQRPQFDRAMHELQEKFLALKVEERYDPFTYVWDTVAHRWPESMRSSRALSPVQAAGQIIERYFVLAAFANEAALARILRIPRAMVERAARRLELEGQVRRGLRVEGLPGVWSVLASRAE